MLFVHAVRAAAAAGTACARSQLDGATHLAAGWGRTSGSAGRWAARIAKRDAMDRRDGPLAALPGSSLREAWQRKPNMAAAAPPLGRAQL